MGFNANPPDSEERHKIKDFLLSLTSEECSYSTQFPNFYDQGLICFLEKYGIPNYKSPSLNASSNAHDSTFHHDIFFTRQINQSPYRIGLIAPNYEDIGTALAALGVAETFLEQSKVREDFLIERDWKIRAMYGNSAVDAEGFVSLDYLYTVTRVQIIEVDDNSSIVKIQFTGLLGNQLISISDMQIEVSKNSSLEQIQQQVSDGLKSRFDADQIPNLRDRRSPRFDSIALSGAI